MTTEKSGFEKLMNADSSLCQLTAEELELVAGGYNAAGLLIDPDNFPLGIRIPHDWSKLRLTDQLIDQIGPVDIGNGLPGLNRR